MSTSAVGRAVAWVRPDLSAARVLALIGLATLLASFAAVLWTIVDVSGDLLLFYAVFAGAVLVATALARVLRVAVALAFAGIGLTIGMAAYVLSLPYDPAIAAMIESNVRLLGGQSVLEIERSAVWALSVTPTPVFALWYLGLRGWYTAAVAVGSGMLGYFVLTGDAGVPITLLGVVGASAALGFGDVDHSGGSIDAGEAIALVLAVMVIAPLAVSVVPGGGASGLDEFGSAGRGGETIEATLLSTESSFEIAGSIELSTERRYTVTSAEPRYWRTTSYNRYTGDGWVRSGETVPYAPDRLSAPPGPSRELTQVFEAESAIRTVPAAWRPVSVDGAGNATQITADGGLTRLEPFEAGDSYQVTSAVPAATAEDLDGGEDPGDIVERYTQLPDSTPDRVERRTENVVGNASERYRIAQRVERWLERNREYSLDVDRPEGTIADSFLFEMEQGYCTYYATTMVTMLRTQEVPARLTVGYTTGERTDPNQYVVRGYNSHAWVEVYFPDAGWIRFDPTPAAPREAAEQARLAEARSENDTDETTPTPTNATPTSTPTPTPTPTPTNGSTNGDPLAPDQTTEQPDGSVAFPDLPSTEEMALGVVVVVGVAAGLRRTGLASHAYRLVWVRYQPRRDPEADIEGAYRRAAHLLERRSRPRRTGETMRSYLADVDAPPEARRLVEIRERARYGGEATPELADEAVELVGRLRRR